MYFDNFKVTIQTGNIIEENHYYSYGLKIAAISSRKLPDVNEGTIKNNNLYNDKELWDDGDLNWYDYGFRNYDPQIGRFTQLDPLTDDYPYYTPYQFAGDEPIANVDIDGLEQGLSIEASFAKTAIETANFAGPALENLVIYATKTVVKAVKSTSSAWSIAGSFFKGVGSSLWSTVTAVGNIVAHPITTAENLIDAAAHPIRTITNIKNAVVNTYVAFRDGDAKQRAEILGNLTGEIAQTLVGGQLIKVASKIAKGTKVEKIIAKITKVEEIAESEAKGGVYALKDGDKVVRTGRTKDLARRELEHANDPTLGKYKFEERYRTDNYAEQRGLEHKLHTEHEPTASRANGGHNKIKAIGDKNKNKSSYIQAAEEFLKKQ